MAFLSSRRAHQGRSPHNPTGTVHRRQDLERLATLAARYGVTVLSDEIHAPLVLPGRTHHPFVSVSPEAAGHGMVLTSASKAWNLAGLKCAAIITAGPAARRLVERLPEELPWRVGHLGVLGSIAAFREGGPWLDEVLGVLDHHRHYLAELLAARIPGIRSGAGPGRWTPSLSIAGEHRQIPDKPGHAVPCSSARRRRGAPDDPVGCVNAFMQLVGSHEGARRADLASVCGRAGPRW